MYILPGRQILAKSRGNLCIGLPMVPRRNLFHSFGSDVVSNMRVDMPCGLLCERGFGGVPAMPCREILDEYEQQQRIGMYQLRRWQILSIKRSHLICLMLYV